MTEPPSPPGVRLGVQNSIVALPIQTTLNGRGYRQLSDALAVHQARPGELGEACPRVRELADVDDLELLLDAGRVHLSPLRLDDARIREVTRQQTPPVLAIAATTVLSVTVIDIHVFELRVTVTLLDSLPRAIVTATARGPPVRHTTVSGPAPLDYPRLVLGR